MSYRIETNEKTPVETKLECHLTKTELAQLLKRGVRTIEQWMSDGLIPYYKTGRRVTFIYSEVDSALRSSCRVSARSQETHSNAN